MLRSTLVISLAFVLLTVVLASKDYSEISEAEELFVNELHHLLRNYNWDLMEKINREKNLLELLKNSDSMRDINFNKRKRMITIPRFG
ncbi:hypothetical protein SNEBB_010792 [Seison nebaliae]|nr:hypothetical protein SNEBB_010792 [Seison nebaliae]